MNSSLSYRELVGHTMNHDLGWRDALVNVGLGLTGEAGEVADLIKKHIAQGHELNRDALIKECGDLHWYLEYAAIILGTTTDEIRAINTKKLLARYPGGFTVKASTERQA